MADVKTYISAAYIPTAEDFVGFHGQHEQGIHTGSDSQSQVLKRYLTEICRGRGCLSDTSHPSCADRAVYLGHRFDDQVWAIRIWLQECPSSLPGDPRWFEKMFRQEGQKSSIDMKSRGSLMFTISSGQTAWEETCLPDLHGAAISLLIAFIATTINLIIGMNYRHLGYFGEMMISLCSVRSMSSAASDTGRCHAPHDHIKARNRFHYFRPDAPDGSR